MSQKLCQPIGGYDESAAWQVKEFINILLVVSVYVALHWRHWFSWSPARRGNEGHAPH